MYDVWGELQNLLVRYQANTDFEVSNPIIS